MMKRLTPVFLTLLVLSSAIGFAPPAQALPNEIYTEYFDCNVAFIGWHLIECDATGSGGGAQSGSYKSVERIRCDGSGSTVRWYDCSTGGTCTLMSSPPTPPPPGTYYCREVRCMAARGPCALPCNPSMMTGS